MADKKEFVYFVMAWFLIICLCACCHGHINHYRWNKKEKENQLEVDHEVCERAIPVAIPSAPPAVPVPYSAPEPASDYPAPIWNPCPYIEEGCGGPSAPPQQSLCTGPTAFPAPPPPPVPSAPPAPPGYLEANYLGEDHVPH